ncbi:carboxypeptidase M32, partial [Cribrihabitans sp. XS_ASV171]
AQQRAEEMAAIESVLHARRSDPRVGDWLEAAQGDDPVQGAQLREIRRAFDRANKVPAALATRIARVTSEAQGVWAQARADEDVAGFLPILTEVVALRREEGAALAQGGNIYDALVEDYEPETTGDQIAAIFDAMRPRLVALRAAILDRPAPRGLDGSFDANRQMQLS